MEVIDNGIQDALQMKVMAADDDAVSVASYEEPALVLAADDSSSSEDETGDETSDRAEVRKLFKTKDLLLRPFRSKRSSSSKHEPKLSLNVRKFEKNDYMARRIMTATQERWNGYSVLPSSIFCLWFCLSGAWLQDTLTLDAETTGKPCVSDGAGLPPLPILSVAVGILLHAPFSFIYHWYYCVVLPPGKARFDHWSRRLDQGFIHVASAFLSYGTSGSKPYFLLNVVYNGQCLFRQLTLKTATPVQTQLRILLSMIMYTCPLLQRREFELFAWIWLVLGVSVYFFATYPIRGWSHCAFHIIVAFAPPLLMHAASTLEESKEAIARAMQCEMLAP